MVLWACARHKCRAKSLEGQHRTWHTLVLAIDFQRLVRCPDHGRTKDYPHLGCKPEHRQIAHRLCGTRSVRGGADRLAS